MNDKGFKKLFLIDGLGALVSAFVLAVILVKFEHYFGIPIKALYFLAGVAIIFAIYDGYCYFIAKQVTKGHLLLIAYANLSYCLLSLGVGIYHRSSLSLLAWLFIAGELAIISTIAWIEIRATKTA